MIQVVHRPSTKCVGVWPLNFLHVKKQHFGLKVESLKTHNFFIWSMLLTKFVGLDPKLQVIQDDTKLRHAF